MPTVLRRGPYRFFFYSADGSEPPHVHVERDDCEAKFWLDPLLLAGNRGFDMKALRRIRYVLEWHRDTLLEKWNEFFNS